MSNQDIKYPHYFKSVSHLETVDVYRVFSLFLAGGSDDDR